MKVALLAVNAAQAFSHVEKACVGRVVGVFEFFEHLRRETVALGRKFYSVVNFQTMFAQFPEFGLMSLGVMVCMISSGIDLSTVGVANMTSITMALLMRRIANGGSELSPVWILPIFALALLIGAVAGLLNGVLIAKLKIPPILATLGTGELFSGIGIVLTGGGSLLRGLEELISAKTGINTMTAEDPMTAVAIGTGKYVEFLAGYKED